ncbi:ferredoxin [Bacteroidia bacterium]|nr:ferredoxin [Bacteroidia bacterium]
MQSGMIGIGLVIFLLTFLFGRIYCSVICPLGILQDIIARFGGRGKKKNKKRRWYHYSKPYNIVRYSLLAICLIFLIIGNVTPLLYLDPYSNFGRIAVNIFRPIAMEGNNALNWVATQFGNYSFYHITIHTVTAASFTIALVALLVVGVLSFLRGRLFCNTLCPVGSILGLISRYSIFKVRIDENKCKKCGVCAKNCKSECIDSKAGKIDYSRCVGCFNCLRACNVKALKYQPVIAGLTRNPMSNIKESSMNSRRLRVKPAMTMHNDVSSRRKFLATSTAIAATLPLVPAWAKGKQPIDPTKVRPITPPGSKSLAHFKGKCTACHLCITHCPMQVLKPAGFQFGLEYAFKPHLAFDTEHYCNYQCTICSHICPNGAIHPVEQEEKQVTQIGVAQFERSRCVVFTDHHSCGACSEHCPVQAVKMVPYEDGLTIPHVYEEICIGCGGCESICPIKPVKAINVLANEIHKQAQKPVEEEAEKVNTEELDFGF